MLHALESSMELTRISRPEDKLPACQNRITEKSQERAWPLRLRRRRRLQISGAAHDTKRLREVLELSQFPESFQRSGTN